MTKGNTLLFWYTVVSVLRENVIYTIYQQLCPPLSIYIYTVVCREGVGDEVRRIWKNVTPPSTFQNRIRFMQNIFGKISQLPFFRSVEVPQTSSCYFFLSDLSILWQCKGILSSKQDNKFQHTQAASTKLLGWIEFIFSNPTFLVSAHHCIYMYI